jgi:hypothetical protein
VSETRVRRRATPHVLVHPGELLARFGADMVTAIRVGGVRGGFVATILLAVGSLTPAYLPQSSPYWEPARALGLDSAWAKALGTGMVLAGVGLLMVVWFNLRPTIYVGVKHWAVLLWWSLPLLFAPPIFSHDAYSYAAHGWLIHNGLNPYDASPSYLPGPFADQVAWAWRYTSTPYGPLSLQISHGLVELAGLNPYYSAVLHRIPALVGVALIVIYLPRLAHLMNIDPRSVAWFATINPLLVIDFVGGAHNDALMVGSVALALYLAFRGRMFWALIVVGIGAAIKQPAILAAYPVAVIGSGWAGWKMRHLARFALRLAYAFALPIAVFCAISVASGLGFGWVNAVTVPGMILTMAPFSLVGFAIQWVVNLVTGDPTGQVVWKSAQTLGLVLSAGLVSWLAVRLSRTRPVTFLAYAYLIFAAFGPAMHPWYLTWGGLLLPLTRPSPRVWRIAAVLVSILLVYDAGNLAWRNDLVGLALAALAAGVIVLYWRRRRGHRPLEGVGDEGQ